MLCCKCKKNQATNTCEKSVDGKKRTEYYCSDCYRRLFIAADDASPSGEFAVCPRCGTTTEDFRAGGLVGCAECYRFLAAEVIPAVIRMQGREAHCGKVPKKRAQSREELERRRKDLQAEVEKRLRARDFEQARKYSEELKDVNVALERGEVND